VSGTVHPDLDGRARVPGLNDLGDIKVPPVTEIGMASLALIVIAGIYLAAYLPKSVPLVPAVILLVLSFALLAGNLLVLARVKGFAWRRFWQIFRWALAAYVITAGMIEYAFVRDSVRGGPLVVLTLAIVIYAVHVPVLIAFTVARFHRAENAPMPAA
jgi:hypothetical protein